MNLDQSSTSRAPGNPWRATALRVAAAVAVLIGGLIHLQLYFDGYRDVPNANLGRSFLLNAVASAVIACALVISRQAIVRISAIGLVAGTLVAFFVSRTDRGIFGFSESGLNPSPQAVIALVVEIAALLLLVATFLPAVGTGDDLAPRLIAPVVAVVALLTIGGAVLWAQSDGDQAPAAGSAIPIADFTFGEGEVTVAAGSTVTWRNDDPFEHTIVGADGAFESPVLEQGDTFEFTFPEPGEYTYACGIHPTMTGTIVVE